MELSVVVPTYNQADLLRHSMRSVVDQTLNPAMYEIIVVDDGSTDHTGEVLEEFRSRVTPVRLKVNRGRSAARNAGVAAAGAPRIVFIDSDVVVRPDFLHWHLDTHRKHGKGIVCRGPVVLLYNMDDAMARRPIRAVGSPHSSTRPMQAWKNRRCSRPVDSTSPFPDTVGKISSWGSVSSASESGVCFAPGRRRFTCIPRLEKKRWRCCSAKRKNGPEAQCTSSRSTR